MNIMELVLNRQSGENQEYGSKIPWNDPEFSRRMLENHLSQDHDWASRRKDIIARHVSSINKRLNNIPSRILDLGCGPGFYTRQLAEMGHECIGVDFSPASIAYARQQSIKGNLKLHYELKDIRNYESEIPFDCILMTFGEFNVFTRQDASAILKNCSGMLRNNGHLILETHTYEAVKAAGSAPASWQRHEAGLFSDKPHLCLQENIWKECDDHAFSRYFVIDAASADIQTYSSFMHAYTMDGYHEMLSDARFHVHDILAEDEWPSGSIFSGNLQVFACMKTKG